MDQAALGLADGMNWFRRSRIRELELASTKRFHPLGADSRGLDAQMPSQHFCEDADLEYLIID